MKKPVIMMGILALLALMPAANAWAGDGNGRVTVVSLQGGFTPNENAITVVVHGKFTQDNITVTPMPGLTVVGVKLEGNTASVTLTGNPIQSAQNFGGKEVVDIMTIVGIDNITGVFIDDSHNTGNANGTFRMLDATNSENPGDKDHSTYRVNNPVSNDKSNGLSQNSGMQGDESGKGETGFTVYPNPVVGETNVVTVGEILGKSLDVVDLSGRRHKSIMLNGNQRSTINLGDLPPGIYMLIMTTEDGRNFVQRISKL